jgi:hypothetical protein
VAVPISAKHVTMPSAPSEPGQGLVRSYQLLLELRRDVVLGYEALESNRESQYLRRSLVRAIFSFIEAGVEVIKIEVRSTVRSGEYGSLLSEKEKELLGGAHLMPAPVAKFISLEANVRRTFRLAANVWAADFKLNSSGTDFRDFVAAKEARNKLTHPRTFYEIEVTDHDMHLHTVAGVWFQTEFHRLFQARIRAMARDLAAADREQFLRDFS